MVISVLKKCLQLSKFVRSCIHVELLGNTVALNSLAGKSQKSDLVLQKYHVKELLYFLRVHSHTSNFLLVQSALFEVFDSIELQHRGKFNSLDVVLEFLSMLR